MVRSEISSRLAHQNQRPSNGETPNHRFAGRREAACVAAKLGRLCPLWVISGHDCHEVAMSALPPKADIAERRGHVRFCPKADIRPEFSLAEQSVELIVQPDASSDFRVALPAAFIYLRWR